jgi:hypothetical protein
MPVPPFLEVNLVSRFLLNKTSFLPNNQSAVLSIETKYFINHNEQAYKTSLGLEEKSLNH